MTAQLIPNSMSLPPPAVMEFDLLDGDRVVGWVKGSAIGFQGFGTATEAAHAAWVAYRTLSRALARRRGERPVPIDIEPLALAREGERETILASGRAIATLLRRNGDESFAFELDVPEPIDTLGMRSLAYRLYRTLRKSGLRWALWSTPHELDRQSDAVRAERAPVPDADDDDRSDDRSDDRPREGMGDAGWAALGLVSVFTLVLALVAPDELGAILAAIGVAGLLVFRLTAPWDTWVGRRSGKADRRVDGHEDRRRDRSRDRRTYGSILREAYNGGYPAGITTTDVPQRRAQLRRPRWRPR